MPRKLDTDSFIKLANETHNGKYIYTEVEYVNSRTKVCIICPIHGKFLQTPNSHLQGCGCPKCQSQKRRRTLEEVIERANLVHQSKYKYDRAIYTNDRTEICITCPIHGDFLQKVAYHLNGNGCPKCAIENRTSNADELIKKASIVHNGKYDYSKVNDCSVNTKVCIICPEHGEFWQRMHDHLKGCGCSKCANKLSNGENELFEFIKTICNDAIQRERNIISPYELDIYIPSKRIAIEYNGITWHSEKFKGNDAKTYHLMKTNLCKEKEIKLIHLFEDEWLEKKEIVKSMLTEILCR